MRRFACILPLFLAMLGACTNDPVQPEKGVTVTTRNLPPTSADFYYKLWFSYPAETIIDKQPRPDHEESTYFAVGSFRVNEAGEPVGLNGGSAGFIIPEGYSAALVADALLTLERTGSTDTLPGPILLAGEFVGTASQGIDTLTLSGTHAFGERMAEVFAPDTAHRFILNTPTTTSDDDFAKGIWFVTLQNGVFTSSIDLPRQPVNDENPEWEYESWLVDHSVAPNAAGRYVSLGRFLSPSAADQTGPGPGRGPEAGLAYAAPGEDFVTSPERVLTSGGYGLVVSLQPAGIPLERPFVTLLRRDTIPAGLGLIQPDSLETSTSQPRLEVRIER